MGRVQLDCGREFRFVVQKGKSSRSSGCHTFPEIDPEVKIYHVVLGGVEGVSEYSIGVSQSSSMNLTPPLP